MKLYKLQTSNETFLVLAKDKLEAESLVIKKYFNNLLDDELSDLFDLTEFKLQEGIVDIFN